ncbi:MAG: virulence factor [Sneathiella sp.]|uniref:virulence factor n=1 Tax=Sneathiella sp. TaxID=1964365 RepID=UPI00300312CA
MAQLSILYWRDIPSQVVVKQGRKNAKVLLSERFQVAIDMAAMRDGSHETDAYLEGWRKVTAEQVDGDMQEAADTAAAKIEADYDKDVVKRLVANGGRESDA